MRVHNEIATAGARVTGERLCYFCNEGNCALCTGWDRTVVEGKILDVPCAHGCHEAQRKPNGRVAAARKVTQRPA